MDYRVKWRRIGREGWTPAGAFEDRIRRQGLEFKSAEEIANYMFFEYRDETNHPYFSEDVGNYEIMIEELRPATQYFMAEQKVVRTK